MLRLGSLVWSAQDVQQLTSKFEKLGFDISSSPRHPENQCVYFGPDAIELENQGKDGIVELQFDSDDIAQDYKAIQQKGVKLDKPQVAMNNNTPLWFGFDLPQEHTTEFKGSVVMDSPEAVVEQSKAILPLKHPNTCFGVESITVASAHPAEFAKSWSALTSRPCSQIAWNEMVKATGYRVLAGSKFIDCLQVQQTQPVFMLTLKVTDLELAKEMCVKAGAKVVPCATRDGFIVPGHPHIRFVRYAWTRYLPPTQKDFPFYRREDHFRPLGGAYTSTLTKGFEDSWH